MAEDLVGRVHRVPISSHLPISPISLDLAHFRFIRPLTLFIRSITPLLAFGCPDGAYNA